MKLLDVEAAKEAIGFGSSLSAGWKMDSKKKKYAPTIYTGNGPRDPYGSD